MIVIPSEQTTFPADLRGLEGSSVISYLPVASTEHVLAGTLFARSGTIVVARAEFDESAGSLSSGTFSGELALHRGRHGY